MQPTCRHVPPRNGSFSTTTVFSPSSPARIAATYPPGPLPIIATSYFATLNLPSVGGPFLGLAPPPRPLRAGLGFRSRTSVRSPAHAGGCRSAPPLPLLERRQPGKLRILSAVPPASKSSLRVFSSCAVRPVDPQFSQLPLPHISGES